MPSWFRSVFGKSASKRIAEAERFAAVERWPEAIEILKTALAEATDEEGPARSEIPRRIEAYSKAYVALLEEAIVQCMNEEDREKAEELLSIALMHAGGEEKKRELRSLLDRAAPKPKAPPPEEERADEPFGDELIDSLLHGYAEGLGPKEREAILRRPFSLQKAFVLYQQGDAEGATRAAEEYVSKDARDPYGHHYLGLSLAALGRTEEAARAFDTAILLDESLHQASLGLAAMERRLGNRVKAIDLLERVLSALRSEENTEAEGEREETFHLLLQLLLETGESGRVDRLYHDLRKRGRLPAMPAVEARLAEARGDFASAAERWETHLEARSAGETITGRSARAAGPTAEEIEDAADFYRRRENRKRALALYERAALLVTQRIHYSGERFLLPDLLRLKKMTAIVCIEAGRTRDAAKIVEELEREAPGSAEAAEVRRALEEAS
jgi:tetratricopeptide (TPR) repeat protein